MSSTVLSQFRALGVSPTLVQALEKGGLVEPTPIQQLAIPPALAGKDVMGCAQTGTGKTAAFVIPMIERLAEGPKSAPRGLILAPTRELAFQIQTTITKFGRARGIFGTTLVGGDDMQAQIRGLRQRPDILVATPGRLLDHMWQGTVSFAKLQIVVLDEADRMLDMGFAPQLNQIIEALPLVRQTLLFSATMPDNLGDLARISLKDPVKALVSKSATPAEGVTHTLHHTVSSDKTPLLISLLKETKDSVLVFTRTKHRADRIGETLEKIGHRVAVMHAGRRLGQRRNALEGFRRGRFQILVATDIAARGLDVDNIRHVINYDLPNVPEDYVHRIGRTARMKATGWATSFVTEEDVRSLRAIERLLGKAVPVAPGSRPPVVSHAAHRRPHSHGTNGNGPRGPRPNRPGYGSGNGPGGPRSDRPRRNQPGRGPRPSSYTF
ncbi:MAG: DEAD/DEAH box helicase [Nitrospirales bacterium]|nr:DEAD/DEAH box helicase [Nitrospirales bacterium]